jgi:hypothetical protein
MKEEDLYISVAYWLDEQAYQPVIAGGRRRLSIPLVSYLPGKLFLEPDVVGLRESSLVAVEVKVDATQIIDGLGKCLVYSAAADKVYLALPQSLCDKITSRKLFEQLKLGLLSVTSDEVAIKQITDTISARIPSPAKTSFEAKIRKYGYVTDRPVGPWTVEEKVAPGTNYNIDYAGLHVELLRQTKAALGKD